MRNFRFPRKLIAMEQSRLRKLLKDDKQCNPFNDSFDYPSLLAKLVTNIPKPEWSSDAVRHAIPITPILHQEYTDYYQFLNRAIEGCNISFDQLLELSFAAFNRNFLVLAKMQTAQMKQQKVFDLEKHYSYKIQSLNQNVGKVEASGALEADVDGINMFLNYLRYYSDKNIAIDPTLNPLHPIETSKRILLMSNLYCVSKHEYENAIWNNGTWQHEELNGSHVFTVDFDSAVLITGKAGLLRLQRNIIFNFYSVVNELNRETRFGKIMREQIEKRKRDKRIKDVTVKNGCIQYKLAKGFSAKDCFHELNNMTAIATFYNFLKAVKLPNLTGLALSDLIGMFSLLQDLLGHCSQEPEDDSIFSVQDVDKFPIKIEIEQLTAYYLQRTDYSKQQVKEFLAIISSPFGERLSLWDKPLVRYNGFFYITYVPAVQPVLYNLVDTWLDSAGYSLDQRGTQLEEYLSAELRKDITKRGWTHFIPIPGKKYNKQKQFEEIDLIVNLKDVVICAEIKCIKFPMEVRDHHNAMKRLHIASKQVKRKVDFIKKYSLEMMDQIGITANKTFLPIIITNNPIYSTLLIEGVVVTDFYLFESYFNTGKFTTVEVAGGSEKVTKETLYYNNEYEMNRNIDSFLRQPPPVDTLKRIFRIVSTPIVPGDPGYQINIATADYNEELIPEVPANALPL